MFRFPIVFDYMYSRIKNKFKRRDKVIFNRKSILEAIASFSVVLMLLILIPAGASAASTTCDRTTSDQTTCYQNNCNSECEQVNCGGTCCDVKPVAMEHVPNYYGDFGRECLRKEHATCPISRVTITSTACREEAGTRPVLP